MRTRQHGQRKPLKRLRGCHGPLGRHELGNQGVIAFYCHGLSPAGNLVQYFPGKMMQKTPPALVIYT